jgi:site-specific recombinase XerD
MARPKKLPTVLTEDEQEQLLEQANPVTPLASVTRRCSA